MFKDFSKIHRGTGVKLLDAQHFTTVIECMCFISTKQNEHVNLLICIIYTCRLRSPIDVCNLYRI